MQDHQRSLHSRCDLLQKFRPLAAYRGLEIRESRCVSSRPSHALDEAAGNIGRKKERKQFFAFSACACLHAAQVELGRRRFPVNGHHTPRTSGPRSAQFRKDAHSMTSSARIMIVGGTVKFEALAVLRLMTSSNLVGCSTGMSAGFAPLRMRSTISAPRRHCSPWSVP